MSRFRIAMLATLAACGLLVGSAGVASAKTTKQSPRLTQVVKLTGKSVRSGTTRRFSGTYTIDRFVSRDGKLWSVGTVKGKLGNKSVTKRNVMAPATLGGQQGAQTSQVLPPIPGACEVLNLLGPITLNLLGLVVRTNQINVRIDAVPGNGNLLGNLLCSITNLLNPSTVASTPTGQLARILNALLALSPRAA